MSIELDGWSIAQYLGVISELMERNSNRLAKYCTEDAEYMPSPAIEPNGTFSEEYILLHDGKEKSCLGSANTSFEQYHGLFSIAELIVDDRQLDARSGKKVDLSDKSRTIGMLLRHDEMKPVAEKYIEQGGYFAVIPDKNRTAFHVVTPHKAVMSDELMENNIRFNEALSKIKPHKMHYLSGNYSNKAMLGGCIVYLYELFTHPGWKPIGNAYVEGIFFALEQESLDTLAMIAADLLERGIEFMPTPGGLCVIAGALAFATLLDLLPIAKGFVESMHDELRSRDMSEDDILEILLNE